jgi:hypothetical protein
MHGSLAAKNAKTREVGATDEHGRLTDKRSFGYSACFFHHSSFYLFFRFSFFLTFLPSYLLTFYLFPLFLSFLHHSSFIILYKDVSTYGRLH